VVFEQLLELGFVGLAAVPGGTRHGGLLLVEGRMRSSVTMAMLQRVSNWPSSSYT
jgi:hypothetical protein